MLIHVAAPIPTRRHPEDVYFDRGVRHSLMAIFSAPSTVALQPSTNGQLWHLTTVAIAEKRYM
jgi:hypothetical protein